MICFKKNKVVISQPEIQTCVSLQWSPVIYETPVVCFVLKSLLLDNLSLATRKWYESSPMEPVGYDNVSGYDIEQSLR